MPPRDEQLRAVIQTEVREAFLAAYAKLGDMCGCALRTDGVGQALTFHVNSLAYPELEFVPDRWDYDRIDAFPETTAVLADRDEPLGWRGLFPYMADALWRLDDAGLVPGDRNWVTLMVICAERTLEIAAAEELLVRELNPPAVSARLDRLIVATRSG